MDYATKKLTYELQKLQVKSAKSKAKRPRLPKHFTSTDFAVSSGIASYLRSIDAHQQATVDLEVGCYH